VPKLEVIAILPEDASLMALAQERAEMTRKAAAHREPEMAHLEWKPFVPDRRSDAST
jgi:hypothetical protein